MRALLYLCALFAALTAVLAWTKEDYEIFDLVSELEQHEGESNWHDWIASANLFRSRTWDNFLFAIGYFTVGHFS